MWDSLLLSCYNVECCCEIADYSTIHFRFQFYFIFYFFFNFCKLQLNGEHYNALIRMRAISEVLERHGQGVVSDSLFVFLFCNSSVCCLVISSTLNRSKILLLLFGSTTTILYTQNDYKSNKIWQSSRFK